MSVFAYQISSFKFPTAKGTPKKPTQIRVKKIFNLLPVYRDDICLTAALNFSLD